MVSKGVDINEALNLRIALPNESETVAGVVTLAFAADPLWSWAMSREDERTEHHKSIWRIFVEGALRYPSSWILGDGAAVSVWIPPGGSDMTEDQEFLLHEVAAQNLGSRASRFFEVVRLLEEAHPRSVDHYYLSLLGTHPGFRGHGVGMKLLAHNLTIIDGFHYPAYLESSNPANDERYKNVGFEHLKSIQAPDAGPKVSTMWRAAR